MSQLHINDIRISYQGQDLSQFGLFPLVAWYLIDVLKLPDYFQQVTVNKKRNHNQSRKPKKARLYRLGHVHRINGAADFGNFSYWSNHRADE